MRRSMALADVSAIGGQIADVAVAVELHPGPAVALVVDGDELAEQRLRVQLALRVGHARSGTEGTDHLPRSRRRVARRVDTAAQGLGGEIGADRRLRRGSSGTVPDGDDFIERLAHTVAGHRAYSLASTSNDGARGLRLAALRSERLGAGRQP